MGRTSRVSLAVLTVVCVLSLPSGGRLPPGAKASFPRPGEAEVAWRELLLYAGADRPLPEIRVYRERLSFQRAAAGYVSTGAASAVGFYLDGRVHVVEQGDAGADRRVLRHELVHALLDGGGRVPRWFHEGLATYLEETAVPVSVPPAVLASRFRRLRPDLGDGAWSDPGRLRRLYAASRTAVRYLAVTRGEEALRELAGRLARGEDFDAAFAAVYGVPWPAVAAELAGPF